MNDEFNERFYELLTLLGEVPTEVLAKKATAMFPGLADDPVQRADFREHLRWSVECMRQVPRTEREAAQVIAFLQAGFEIVSAEVDGETVEVGVTVPIRKPRTVEDILSASAVDLRKADAAEALAEVFRS